MTDIRKVHEGVADRSKTYELLNRHNDKPYAERTEELFAGEWWEITEGSYDEFLEVVPPLMMESGGFVMGEAKIGSIYSAFYRIEIDGERRYFHASVPMTSRQDFFSYRNAIEDSIHAESTPKP